MVETLSNIVHVINRTGLVCEFLVCGLIFESRTVFIYSA
jgi:hypothetical protein